MDNKKQCFPLFYMFNGCMNQLQEQTKEKEEEIHNLSVFVEKDKKVVMIPVGQTDLRELGYITKKKKWTQEQDKLLISLTQACEVDWQEISTHFPNRNPKMCYNRYRRLENMNERSWTTKDDELIISLVQKFGQDWNAIKQSFPKRTEKQIKDHYKNYLRPDLDKSEWDLKTDMEFVRLLSLYGCDWMEIQKYMPERPYPQIKNRYYGRVAKIIAKKLNISLK